MPSLPIPANNSKQRNTQPAAACCYFAMKIIFSELFHRILNACNVVSLIKTINCGRFSCPFCECEYCLFASLCIMPRTHTNQYGESVFSANGSAMAVMEATKATKKQKRNKRESDAIISHARCSILCIPFKWIIIVIVLGGQRRHGTMAHAKPTRCNPSFVWSASSNDKGKP